MTKGPKAVTKRTRKVAEQEVRRRLQKFIGKPVRTQKTVDIAYRSFEEVLVDLKASGLSDEKIDLLLEDLR
jgi:hypothetical protein